MTTRAFHRILAITTVVVMLFLGVTGTLIQSIDLYALHTGAPQADSVMLSINEGRWGNGELAAITIDDLDAPALPQDFNFDQAFLTMLRAMRVQAPDAAPNYAEVRMVGSTPVGQVRLGADIKAFDARTGEPVTALVGATSLVAAVLLLCVAFSGTWLGFESVYSSLQPRGQGGPGEPATLSAAEALQMAGVTLASFRALEPQTPIKALRVRMFGTMKQGVIIAGGDNTRQVLINTANGELASLTEPEYPKVGFPFGVQTHENIKHFHSGDLFGLPARWLSLLNGLALVYLSISGIVMYFSMWNKRQKTGHKGLLWM